MLDDAYDNTMVYHPGGGFTVVGWMGGRRFVILWERHMCLWKMGLG